MSSIRSASSRTSTSSPSSLAYLYWKWSRRRPGRRDDDVDAAAEGVLLRAHADAAVDRGAGERRVHREVAQVLVDLRGELAGRGEDQGARRAALLAHQPVQDREQERRALAAAGHRAGEDVAALEGRRDGVVLDRRRAGEAQGLHALQQIGVKVERGKGHADNSSFCAATRSAYGLRSAARFESDDWGGENGDCRKGRRPGAGRPSLQGPRGAGASRRSGEPAHYCTETGSARPGRRERRWRASPSDGRVRGNFPDSPREPSPRASSP